MNNITWWCLLSVISLCLVVMSHELRAQTEHISVSPALTPNPPSKTGWVLNFTDEFNGSRKPNWINQFIWGNTHPASPFHHFDDNYNQTSSTLDLIAKKEWRSHPGMDVVVEKPYTSAMINSDNGYDDYLEYGDHKWMYGYFEVRCNNPKSQRMWPSFWLYGKANVAPFSPSYEIDVFEFGTGDGLVMTNHVGDDIIGQKWIYSMPGQSFGDTWVTYAVKWEPNKIIWYINNKAVRIFTDQGFPNAVPNIPLRVKVMNAIDPREQNDHHIPPVFPNSMSIDYVRVFKRANHLVADPVFSIDGKSTSTINVPIGVPYTPTQPIWMDFSESYSPQHNYSITVQQITSAGVNIGNPITGQYNNASIALSKNFDLNDFCLSNGMTMASGNMYRITLACGIPIIAKNHFISLVSCAPNIAFALNGVLNKSGNININHNKDKSRLILNATSSRNCSPLYHLSIRECNSAGVGFGPAIGRYLTSQEINNRHSVDVDYFAKQLNLNLSPAERVNLSAGKYYLIRLGVHPVNGAQRVQRVYFNQCASSVVFAINDQQIAYPGATSIQPGDEIIMDGSYSNVCQNQYFVSIQECYSNGNIVPGAVEVSDWMYYSNYAESEQRFYYSIGRIDIRKFSKDRNYVLNCGKYYRIKLAVGSPWVESARVIKIEPCPSVSNDYLINGQSNHTVNLPNFGNFQDCNLTLYAPHAISCDRSYFVAIQKRVAGVYQGPEAADWLTAEEVFKLRITGVFDLKRFGEIRGCVLENDATYGVKLVSGAGPCNGNGWIENNRIVKFGVGSGNYPVQTDMERGEVGVTLFPNPTRGGFQIWTTEGYVEEVAIFDMAGRMVLEVVGGNGIVEFYAPNGVYVVRIMIGDQFYLRRIVMNE